MTDTLLLKESTKFGMKSDDMKSGSVTDKFKETDEKILTIARRLFGQSGIVNIEMNDICKELGCSRSTLYRHFSSKEAILFSLTSESVMRIMEAAIIPPRMTFRNGYEALVWQLKAQVAFMMNNVDEIIFMRDFDYFFPRFIPVTKEAVQFEKEIMSTRGREEMLNSIRIGIEDGSIRPLKDSELTLYTLINACIAMAQRILPRESVYRNELGYGREMLDLQTELLLAALKPERE
ncbi:TetR/AcrR family transcriptional regulator [Enterocloster citroniae]|uniref:TetR/AcrR family transcriptional regulator n=2 Tax=Enterocloster citroniae TaxID=358743 RepID=UPI0032D42D1C